MISFRIGASVLALATAFGISAMSGSLGTLSQEARIAAISVPSFSMVAQKPCTPVPVSRERAVRGLAVSIPHVPGEAERLDFDGSGNVVTYEVSSAADQVADFYLSELSSNCYTPVVYDNGNVYQINGGPYAVRVATAADPLKSGSRVRYELGYLGSAVLGVSTTRYLAQDTGSMPPPPSGDSSGGSMPPPPSNSGSYTPPPSGTSGIYTPPPGDSGAYNQYSGTTPPPPPPTGTFVPFSPSGPMTGDHMGQPIPGGIPGMPYDPSGQMVGGQPQMYPNSGMMNPPYPGQQYQPGMNQYPGKPYPMEGTVPLGSQNQNQWNQQQPNPGMNQGFPGKEGMMGQPGQFGQPGMMGQPASTQRGEQAQFERPGMMGEQGQFGDGQFGQQAGQEMEKQMQERMLSEMKSNMGDFLRQIGFMTKQIPVMRKRLNKCNADFPVELNNALEAIPKLVEDVKNATDPEKAMTAMEAVQDAAGVFEELGPQMGDMMGYCTKITEARRLVKRTDTEVNRLVARAKARKADPDLLSELTSIVSEMKGSLAKAESLAKTDLPEADALVEGIFENTDNLREATETVNMAIDLPSGLKKADATVRSITAKIKALERKKVDVSELKDLLETLKSQIIEVREIAKVKPIDPSALGDALQAAFETREQIFDILQDQGAESTFIPKFQQGQNFQFDFHDSFMQQKPESSGGFEGGFGPSSGGSQFPGSSFGAQSGGLPVLNAPVAGAPIAGTAPSAQ